MMTTTVRTQTGKRKRRAVQPLHAKSTLIEWLVTSGKLRELASLKRQAEKDKRRQPWKNCPIPIQRFTLPDEIADCYLQEGHPLVTRQMHWQGGQLGVDMACQVLLTEREMAALMSEYCRV